MRIEKKAESINNTIDNYDGAEGIIASFRLSSKSVDNNISVVFLFIINHMSIV